MCPRLFSACHKPIFKLLHRDIGIVDRGYFVFTAGDSSMAAMISKPGVRHVAADHRIIRSRTCRLFLDRHYRLFIKCSNAKSLGIADFFQQNARTAFLIPEIKDVGRDRALEDIVAQQHHDLFFRSEGDSQRQRMPNAGDSPCTPYVKSQPKRLPYRRD